MLKLINFCFKKSSLFVLVLGSLLFLTIKSASADKMNSPNYQIEWTNLNMTSGKKTSPDSGTTVTDTAGQTAPGRYTSAGFIVRAGFQYMYSIIPFSFSLSKTIINLGTLTPETFTTETATLTVSSGSAFGYQVTVLADGKLRKNDSVFIPDTQCDNPLDPCTISQAKSWTSTLSYGFGYNMQGTDVPLTFVDETYFRPFPSAAEGQNPAVVMTGTIVGKDKQATITYKVNVAATQEAGSYQNTINFVATPFY